MQLQQAQFVDRLLICSDCHGEFIFTAGEQLFFHDKQFKHDPKRCKPCKSRRSGLSAAAAGAGPAAAGLSRTETRTECSECGIQTTVPFKPTQGRPVLCRQCFQLKGKATAKPAEVPAVAAAPSPFAIAEAESHAQTISALQEASVSANGSVLSPDAAVVAATTMASASPQSSVASAADLASISDTSETAAEISTTFVAAAAADVLKGNMVPAGLLAATTETPKA
jgi:CxxC-x17-CxxC domain-containing protein